MQAFFLSGLLKSRHNLKKTLEWSVRLALPPAQPDVVIDTMNRQPIPDGTILSRMNLTVDIGYTIWWGRKVLSAYEGFSVIRGGVRGLCDCRGVCTLDSVNANAVDLGRHVRSMQGEA